MNPSRSRPCGQDVAPGPLQRREGGERQLRVLSQESQETTSNQKETATTGQAVPLATDRARRLGTGHEASSHSSASTGTTDSGGVEIASEHGYFDAEQALDNREEQDDAYLGDPSTNAETARETETKAETAPAAAGEESDSESGETVYFTPNASPTDTDLAPGDPTSQNQSSIALSRQQNRAPTSVVSSPAERLSYASSNLDTSRASQSSSVGRGAVLSPSPSQLQVLPERMPNTNTNAEAGTCSTALTAPRPLGCSPKAVTLPNNGSGESLPLSSRQPHVSQSLPRARAQAVNEHSRTTRRDNHTASSLSPSPSSPPAVPPVRTQPSTTLSSAATPHDPELALARTPAPSTSASPFPSRQTRAEPPSVAQIRSQEPTMSKEQRSQNGRAGGAPARLNPQAELTEEQVRTLMMMDDDFDPIPTEYRAGFNVQAQPRGPPNINDNGPGIASAAGGLSPMRAPTAAYGYSFAPTREEAMTPGEGAQSYAFGPGHEQGFGPPPTLGANNGNNGSNHGINGNTAFAPSLPAFAPGPRFNSHFTGPSSGGNPSRPGHRAQSSFSSPQAQPFEHGPGNNHGRTHSHPNIQQSANQHHVSDQRFSRTSLYGPRLIREAQQGTLDRRAQARLDTGLAYANSLPGPAVNSHTEDKVKDKA